MKIVLLGDSIRQIGYGKRAAEILTAEGHEVWQPSDNCRFAQYTLRLIWDNREAIKGADVVHWNNGHWDLCDLYGDGSFTPLEQYCETMERIAGILQSMAKKVIFATTTSVWDDNVHNSNETIARFNAAVAPRLEAKGVFVNDLNAVTSSDIKRFICNDKIHLTPEGIEICADIVAKRILEVAAL